MKCELSDATMSTSINIICKWCLISLGLTPAYDTKKDIISDEEFNEKIKYEIECIRKNGGKKRTTYMYPLGYNGNRFFLNDPLIVFNI